MDDSSIRTNGEGRGRCWRRGLGGGGGCSREPPWPLKTSHCDRSAYINIGGLCRGTTGVGRTRWFFNRRNIVCIIIITYHIISISTYLKTPFESVREEEVVSKPTLMREIHLKYAYLGRRVTRHMHRNGVWVRDDDLSYGILLVIYSAFKIEDNFQSFPIFIYFFTLRHSCA